MKPIEPRTLKGFRDYLPQEQAPRSRMIREIAGVFELFGFEPLETPTLEYEDVLAGKYGDEGEQLMYRFKDNGDRDVAMRYDLTIPLARVMAQHGADLPKPFKRYQLAPVWRAENTQKGRYREFVQCDADIVGATVGIADAECIALAEAVLLKLGIEKFTIKVNNRKILNAIMRTVGVAEDKIVDAIRAIDKIEKIGAKGVTAELEEKTGLDANQAEALIRLASTKVPDVGALKTFINHHILKDPQGMEGFAELNAVFSALHEMQVTHAEIDLSLARGLDYYTSTVYETVLTHDIDARRYGTVVAGGRYDTLLSLFTGKLNPAVGVSVGLDRLFSAMQDMGVLSAERVTQVLVLNLSEALEPTYLKMLHALHVAGIRSEIYYSAADFKKQYSFAESKAIPYAIVIGEDEARRGIAAIRDLKSREQIEVPQEDVVAALTSKLA
jgi:histidyl-tRNA synthetase